VLVVGPQPVAKLLKSHPIPFQKTGKKPRKTRKYTQRQVLSGLSYALHTFNPET